MAFLAFSNACCALSTFGAAGAGALPGLGRTARRWRPPRQARRPRRAWYGALGLGLLAGGGDAARREGGAQEQKGAMTRRRQALVDGGGGATARAPGFFRVAVECLGLVRPSRPGKGWMRAAFALLSRSSVAGAVRADVDADAPAAPGWPSPRASGSRANERRRPARRRRGPGRAVSAAGAHGARRPPAGGRKAARTLAAEARARRRGGAQDRVALAEALRRSTWRFTSRKARRHWPQAHRCSSMRACSSSRQAPR